MKDELFMSEIMVVKRFTPEQGHPYLKDLAIEINKDDVKEILELLENKGYDISNMKLER